MPRERVQTWSFPIPEDARNPVFTTPAGSPEVIPVTGGKYKIVVNFATADEVLVEWAEVGYKFETEDEEGETVYNLQSEAVSSPDYATTPRDVIAFPDYTNIITGPPRELAPGQYELRAVTAKLNGFPGYRGEGIYRREDITPPDAEPYWQEWNDNRAPSLPDDLGALLGQGYDFGPPGALLTDALYSPILDGQGVSANITNAQAAGNPGGDTFPRPWTNTSRAGARGVVCQLSKLVTLSDIRAAAEEFGVPPALLFLDFAPNQPDLYVPVSVQALRVSENGFGWLRSRLRFGVPLILSDAVYELPSVDIDLKTQRYDWTGAEMSGGTVDTYTADDDSVTAGWLFTDWIDLPTMTEDGFERVIYAKPPMDEPRIFEDQPRARVTA